MTDTPTSHKPLTIADIKRHQDLTGARKYPAPLAYAGLSRGRLALHALEERVDLENYLRTAGLWTEADEDYLDDLSDRLLPIANHPKPLPPDVPTVEAVREFGKYWQLGNRVVRVRVRVGGSGVCWQSGSALLPVDPADPRWLGPVTLRAVRYG